MEKFWANISIDEDSESWVYVKNGCKLQKLYSGKLKRKIGLNNEANSFSGSKESTAVKGVAAGQNQLGMVILKHVHGIVEALHVPKPRVFPFLKWIVGHESLDILFLSKTKCLISDLEPIISIIRFSNWMMVL